MRRPKSNRQVEISREGDDKADRQEDTEWVVRPDKNLNSDKILLPKNSIVQLGEGMFYFPVFHDKRSIVC